MSSTASDSCSSGSPPGTPSTNPSTPGFLDHSATYIILTHDASPSFLKALPVQKASDDRVLFFTGSGVAAPLLARAAEVLEDKMFLDADNWEVAQSEDEGRSVTYYRTKTAVSKYAKVSTTVDFNKLYVQSRGHTYTSSLNLFADASLRAVISLPSTSALTLHILERPAFTFPRLSQTPKSTLNPTGHPYGMPALTAFQDGWRAWDFVTLGMLPASMLHSKPIDLRHKPLFYIGHLPTFLNLLLTKYLGEPPVAPARFPAIFERGIDPHVDDPEYCHNHSEVPEKDEDWPALPEVLAYRDRVRARLAKVYEELERGERALTRRLARTLVMVLEHDGFHIETLLYMLIQRAGTGILPPPGFATPPWRALAEQWDAIPAPATPYLEVGPCTLLMGHNDQEPDDLVTALSGAVAGHTFGWDNESPRRAVELKGFRVEWRPITNGEFLAFFQGPGKGRVAFPPSWIEEQGETKVRTLYGSVPMDVARQWPVLTAHDDLAAYARWKGGRIPTEAELRVFLDMYQVTYEDGANTGFRAWHPMPATAGGPENCGRGSNGGVWEWTSTLFDEHEGFAGTTIFPGYSSDFFDQKHQVVLGASYATIPRLGDRYTVRNFYQHNYPYPWVGARVAYDL